MFPSILIVDDERSILKSLSGILTDEGFETVTATNGYEALKMVEAEPPDLVLLDIWMPGMDGIDTLKEIKKIHPGLQVIMITGHGTIETAVNATKIGAYDFIEKPISIDKVIVAINNALNFRRLEEENQYLRKKTIEKNPINGNSPAIMEVKKQIAIAAPTEAWVMITGEHGTGKELAAKMIHQISPRADKPLIDVNCSALTKQTAERELLGYEKGVFTDSTARKIGKFELAHQGTLFLDEIGDMDIRTQGTILRILDEKKFQRIGGSRTIVIDLRVIAATSRNLEEETAASRFRKDLFYRLNVVPIHVPPLRARIEDIPELVRFFLGQIAQHNGSAPKRMTPEAVDLLGQYPWPGNVRELKNLLERLEIMIDGDVINAGDIPDFYTAAAARPVPGHSAIWAIDSYQDAKKAFEAEFIRQKLAENNHNIAKTARLTGINKTQIQRVARRFKAS